MLYPKPCCNEPCYKEVQVYYFFQVDKSFYHIFTVKYVLFTYAIQAQVLCTYRDTISRKLYQFKICQNPYLLGRYGLISHPHITPQNFFSFSLFFHLKLCWESCISSKFVKGDMDSYHTPISHPRTFFSFFLFST